MSQDLGKRKYERCLIVPINERDNVRCCVVRTQGGVCPVLIKRT